MPDASFVPLNCSNCGARLEIYGDMERFACGYCGTALVVQRRGGTVALKAVNEAIARVQEGTDRTAAELAIARYEKELGEALAAYRKITANAGSSGCASIGCGSLLAVIGIGSFSSGPAAFGIIAAAGGIALLAYGFTTGNRLPPHGVKLKARIAELQRLIAEKKKIADAP